MKILIVDGSLNYITYIQYCLNIAGIHNISYARNEKEASELLKETPFDLILRDSEVSLKTSIPEIILGDDSQGLPKPFHIQTLIKEILPFSAGVAE